jgi:membrane-associated phospholipid phosphatase
VALTVLSVAFAAVLGRLRQWYWVLTLAAAVGGGMLVNVVLKASYERMRPHFEDPLLVLTSFSFPSGHAAGATLFYGVLAAFLVSRTYDWRRRAAIVAGAIVAVALVAFSRMYLGAHYLSDVLAAICSSTVWLVLCLSAGRALARGGLRLGRDLLAHGSAANWTLFALGLAALAALTWLVGHQVRARLAL